jgi:hypothetical protein
MKKTAWTVLVVVFSVMILIQCSDDSIFTSKTDLTGTYQGTYTVIPNDYYQPNWPGTQIPVICSFTDSSWTLTVDATKEIPPGICMCLAEGWYLVLDDHINFRLVSIIAPLDWCEISYPCVGHDGLFSFDMSPDSDTLQLSQYSETEKATRKILLVRSTGAP